MSAIALRTLGDSTKGLFKDVKSIQENLILGGRFSATQIATQSLRSSNLRLRGDAAKAEAAAKAYADAGLPTFI